jgi:hypothetical protein
MMHPEIRRRIVAIALGALVGQNPTAATANVSQEYGIRLAGLPAGKYEFDLMLEGTDAAPETVRVFGVVFSGHDGLSGPPTLSRGAGGDLAASAFVTTDPAVDPRAGFANALIQPFSHDNGAAIDLWIAPTTGAMPGGFSLEILQVVDPAGLSGRANQIVAYLGGGGGPGAIGPGPGAQAAARLRAVPEPASAALLAAGALGLVGRGRRREAARRGRGSPGSVYWDGTGPIP